MLPQANRLKSDKDFKRLFSKGRFVSHSLFTMKFAPNSLKHSRFGFPVSTKVSKKAVERNRMRRRMREILRKNLKFIAPGFDVAFIPKKPMIDVEHKVLESAMAEAMHRARMIVKR